MVSLILLSTFLLPGCASDPFLKTEFSDADSPVKALTYDSNLRSVLILNSKSGHKFCSEPPPDTEESKTDGVNASGTILNTKEGVELADGIESKALAGRNSTVLMTREILFRACEMAANAGADYESQSRVFLNVLDHIEKIVEQQPDVQNRLPASDDD